MTTKDESLEAAPPKCYPNDELDEHQRLVTSENSLQKPLRDYRKDLSSIPEAVIAPHKPKTIVVVGSTGFLGPYIVAALLRMHSGSRVVCINRSFDGEQRTLSALECIDREHHPNDSARLQFIVANVTTQHLGLTLAHYKMTSGVDEVVFNAWNSNWSLPLEKFEPLLQALRNAIDFCISNYRRPRITFISSICAVSEWPRNHPDQPCIPERVVWDSASAMAHGYGESKCVAEQLLARAQIELGLCTSIVRAGQIGGPAGHSIVSCVWPVQGWLHKIIQASALLGYWPTHVQPLDWIPVDALAKGIVNTTQTKPNSEAVQVFNMVHPQPASWQLLLTTLRNSFGLKAEEISVQEWLNKMDFKKFRIWNFLQATESGREYDMQFENERALEAMPDIVPITEEQLTTWLYGWNLSLGHAKARLH